MKIAAGIALCFGGICLTQPGWAGWQQVGGSVNLNANQNAGHPFLEINGTTPYIAFNETNAVCNHMFVKKFNGSAWESVGGNLDLNTTYGGDVGPFQFSNTTPYVSWTEINGNPNNLVFTKFYNGSNWQLLGTTLNNNANESAFSQSLAIQGTTPYVAWVEFNSGTVEIGRVKRYNGSNWQLVGTVLNSNATHDVWDPFINFYGATPYVAFSESNGTSTAFQVYCKFFNGSSWQTVGQSLSINNNVFSEEPTLYFSNTTPMVGFRESNGSCYDVYAKYYNGAAWLNLGGILNNNSSQNASCVYFRVGGTTPYIAWCETNGTAYQGLVKKFNGSGWENVGGS